MVRAIATRMSERKEEIAAIVAAESGKILSHAAERRRRPSKWVSSLREKDAGITGVRRRLPWITVPCPRSGCRSASPALIIANNTPIANVAWKAFPSILCGNASIMKPSEDTSATAWIFADICREVGLPAGVFSVVNGLGQEAGAPLVESEKVDLVSFTGSCETGKWIQATAGKRLAKVCMELGGKNALVVATMPISIKR